MAEEKPKGDPVFLTIPTTGEKITLPGVTSLNSEGELKAAANDWLAKNYKGPELGAPIVFRTPLMAAEGGFAPGEEIIVQAQPTRPFEGSVLGTAAEAAGNLIGVPGFDPATMQLLAPDQGFLSQFNRAALEAAQPLVQKIELATAAPTAALAGLSQLAYNLGITNEDPRRTAAAAEEFINVGLLPLGTLTGPRIPTARQLLRETPLTPSMAAIAEPTPEVPVVPTTLRRPQAVELPEAPVAAAEIPEAAVAPTPVPDIAPAITPERLAEMRTSAEDVLKGMAAGTPEAPIPERIGAIKTTNFETPDETKQFLANVAEANKNFPEARRGTMTIAEINDLSKDVNLKDILGREVGMPLNAEQIQAAKSVMYQNTDDAIAKAKAWVASGGRDPVAFQEAMDSLVSNTAFFETLQGASSELGRAMRVLRERPSVDVSLAMKQLLEQKADGVPIETIMQNLASFDDPAKAAKYVGSITKPGFGKKTEEYFINALLSGPKTHIYNLASNTGVALTTPLEKYAEAGIGALLRTPDRVTMKEVNARVAGMVQGARDGLALAKQAFINEDVQSGRQLVEESRKAISGTKGKIIRLPTRFLAAQDELFKAMHYRGEIAAQAYTRATKESAGDPDKFKTLYGQYLDNPPESVKKDAVREAEYRTFQSELGRFGKWLQSGANRFLPLRVIFPFVRSPFNLFTYSFERTPLAPVSNRWRKYISGTPRQRNEALAQLTLGSSVLGTMGLLAANDMMTGAGPSDPQERAALLATGWQPYSLKFGETNPVYIPFQRFEPFSTAAGIVADMATMSEYMNDKELERVGAALMFSVSANLAEKTYLQGATNFFDAVFGQGRSLEKAEKFITDTALSFIPNVLRQTSVAIDPAMRDATTFMQKVKDRIPYIRGNDIRVMGTDFNIEAVPERLDIWGDPIVRAPSMTIAGKPLVNQVGSAVFNLLSPVMPTRETTDPVKKEVARLKMGLELPDKKVSLSVNMGQEKPLKFEIELTDRERRQFTFASGIMAKALVEQDIASPEWQQLNDDERRKLIRERMSLSRSQFRQLIAGKAMARYLSENDDLPKIVP